MTAYLVGYRGATMTRDQLLRWRHVTGMDPEFRRRVLACLDASIIAGRPLGIGSTIRTTTGQTDLFLSRHHVAFPGDRVCCVYNGKRYALNEGAAHAAPPGRSYHEDTTTPDEKCLAIDWIGNLAWLKANCARFGLNEFSGVNREPWHSQPRELPKGRAAFRPAKDWPLSEWPIAPGVVPGPTKVDAPPSPLRQGRANNVAAVRELQVLCNFWKWRDVQNRDLVVDGQYGARTAQAVMSMQRAFGIHVDGVYGPQSRKALQGFLDAMAAVA